MNEKTREIAPPLVLRVYLIEVLKINKQMYEKKMDLFVLFSYQHIKNLVKNETANLLPACVGGFRNSERLFPADKIQFESGEYDCASGL